MGPRLIPTPTGTTLTESWDVLPGGIAICEKKYGDQANIQIADRTQQALDGIAKTLDPIKRIAESSTAAPDQHRS